ncbi:JmjC domain-containing protein [Variovorax saccharolyticus]|uniref:JmjC domain-containing protein n=1 Tax=Variovorax saccharolyticus TaxID=3053516 RepID=UPI0025777DA7|nr:cupin domain-containing protein [Variovorax sp. J31P216]MDM0029171.1 cupin domain-containing protein [Variovorax sp. J31P216]
MNVLDFGIDRQSFQTDYFERTPFHRKACFDSEPYSWEVIDKALLMHDPSRERMKVLNNGRVDPEDYVEDFIDIGIRRRRILKDRLYQHLLAGATLVLNRIELSSPEMHELCMQVGRLVGAQTTANSYATLGGAPATNAHWDTHDVFILQLAGRKKWKIFAPTFPLPISNQISNDNKDELPKDVFLETSLEAGDALYLPRGWWHQVTPIDGCETIHLTVAIHTPLVLDYLVWACSNVLPNFLELRPSLLGIEGDDRRVATAVQKIAEVLNQPATLEAFRDRSKERERVITPFQINSLLKDRAFAPLDLLRINSRSASQSTRTHYFNGRRLGFEGDLARIIELLASVASMTWVELRNTMPGADDAVFSSLLRTLARADVIEVVHAT